MTYTMESIENMTSREIESLIATEVMGLECYTSEHGSLMTNERLDDGQICACVVRRYTEDIFSALMVVERLGEMGVTTNIQWKGKGRGYEFTAEVVMTGHFGDFFGTVGHGVGETVPIAICRAAVMANQFFANREGA